MCELMGLSFDQPISARFSLQVFSSRDYDNPHGWGLAWYPDRALALVKEPLNWRSSGYSRFLESYHGVASRIYVAHVRRQTTGGPATYADTHPFGREYQGRDVCFAHNGTIENYLSLPLGRYLPIGATDSERFFCHLLDALARHNMSLDDPVTWEWLTDRLQEVNQHGTLNCIFSDGERLFAYRDKHGWKGMAIRKVRFHESGERIFEDATTEVAVAGEGENHGCLIATRPLSETGWHAVPRGAMVVVEHGAIQFSSEPVSTHPITADSA